MAIKRQSELYRVLGIEPESTASNHQHKAPGQAGYPQARALEKLRRQHVTRIRKLSRK